ncbi:MAG: hypothetical protein ACK5LC_16550 [Coprobacillaceae bacterium]
MYKEKSYVDVIVKMTRDKQMLPLSFTVYEFDKRYNYKVDKITNIKRSAIFEGLNQIAFTCKSGMREYELIFSRNKWYVEFNT